MKIFIFLILLALSGLTLAQYSDSGYEEPDELLPKVNIVELTDFQQTLSEAKRDGKIILLEMSATDCGYCRMLEAEIIKPMLRSGDYDKNVLIRRLHIDSYDLMKNKYGKDSTPTEIARELGVYVTPTLLFLNGDGIEVSKRILGVNTLEFYGGYVDQALEEGLQTLNKHLR